MIIYDLNARINVIICYHDNNVNAIFIVMTTHNRYYVHNYTVHTLTMTSNKTYVLWVYASLCTYICTCIIV